MMKIRTGDHVQIDYANHSVQGEVRLASPNGKNAMLVFPEMPPLGSYFGVMPVLQDDRGTFRDLIYRAQVTVTVRR
jgi:hypothetical protein